MRKNDNGSGINGDQLNAVEGGRVKNEMAKWRGVMEGEGEEG